MLGRGEEIRRLIEYDKEIIWVNIYIYIYNQKKNIYKSISGYSIGMGGTYQ